MQSYVFKLIFFDEILSRIMYNVPFLICFSFIQLFDECMEKHSGVVAMGLIADSGIIQTVPICEVEAYNRMEGFGIFVTIRVVGRGALLELTKQEPYIKAVCIETMDNIPPNLDIPNMIAGNIENFIVSISSLEHKLKMMYEGKQSNGIEDVKDEDMKRRIVEAKLVRETSEL